MLEAISKKKIETVQQVAVALGKLVNFVPTKKQLLPGIKVLVKALERFHYLKISYLLNQNSKPY